MEATHTTDSKCNVDLDVDNHYYFHNPHCAQLNRGLLSGHPMGDHSRLLPTSLVLLLIFSILLPLFQPQIEPELESESTLTLVSTKSGGLIDVANWRIGDEWIYDAEFDVEDLIANGAHSPGVSCYLAWARVVCKWCCIIFSNRSGSTP